METGEEDAAGGCTNRASRVVLGKPDSLLGDPVDGWSVNLLLAINTDFAVTQIVGHDEHDVGRASGSHPTPFQ
jgi:hypothetical protein